MGIGIGIDTGGTYTDAILFDDARGTVLGSAKALTTKQDLSIGILEALDALPQDLVKKAKILSLSTTLATNACVEDRGGRAALAFFGGDARVIDELGGQYGLPQSAAMLIQPAYTNFAGGAEREPDWALFQARLADLPPLDGFGIIEMNAMKNGGVVEKAARTIARDALNVPVICGHELTQELNSLQRGASTLLNARLFPVIEDFLRAIQSAMIQRDICATVVIVRSDGSLMSESFARLRPVETLLCGPAASVIGGARLAKEKDSIIVDMGGTTTDIALTRAGQPVTAEGGVRIGKWKTLVDGLYVKTVGLGGDSAVHYKGDHLILESYRVTPLCVAADGRPEVVEYLRKLLESKRKHSLFLHEHLMLVRDINGGAGYSDFERALCTALRPGPLSMEDAASACGRSVYTMDIRRLVREGIVQVCGLTPTDIMHVRGDFNRYSIDAAKLAAQFVSMNLDISMDELCEQVYRAVCRRMCLSICLAMLEQRFPDYMQNGVPAEVEKLVLASIDSGNSDALNMSFGANCALVGLGAPVRIFLPEVAKMLGTHAVVPDHCEVANALGAIAGQVSASSTVEIRPIYFSEGIGGYTVHGVDGNKQFKTLEEAEPYAEAQAKTAALDEARLRGARGNISVRCELAQQEGSALNATIFLGASATAHAVGAIGF